jgi:hypothetical protein
MDVIIIDGMGSAVLLPSAQIPRPLEMASLGWTAR